jgi:hypothetical protein
LPKLHSRRSSRLGRHLLEGLYRLFTGFSGSGSGLLLMHLDRKGNTEISIFPSRVGSQSGSRVGSQSVVSRATSSPSATSRSTKSRSIKSDEKSLSSHGVHEDSQDGSDDVRAPSVQRSLRDLIFDVRDRIWTRKLERERLRE